MPELVFILVLAFAGYIIVFGVERSKTASPNHWALARKCTPPTIEKTDVLIRGERFQKPRAEVHQMLMKRFPYYRHLRPALKRKFLNRLLDFISKKQFLVKGGIAVKEMPVLASASAIQLSFGLPDYQLPFYEFIRIYPQEYFADRGPQRLLIGNVEQQIITLAWNHVLHSYAAERDGYNTPLHEMAHALYVQKMVVETVTAKGFSKKFETTMALCKTAAEQEVSGEKNLYSSYADKSLQEFWAESVELFFERPFIMARFYPEVFTAMIRLLRQDPRRKKDPLLHGQTRFRSGMRALYHLHYRFIHSMERLAKKDRS